MSFAESVQVFRVQPIRFVERPEKTVKYSRSFNGCTRCKIKHRKCDQKRPSCARCVAAGSPCTYEQPLNHYRPRKEDERRVGGSKQQKSPSSTSSPSPAPASRRSSSAGKSDTALVAPASACSPPGPSFSSFALHQARPEEMATTSLLKGDHYFIRSCGFDELTNIVDIVKGMPHSSPAWSCLNSFSVLSMSLERKDSSLYQRSLETKSVAMRHLRNSLSSSAPVTEIMVSVMLIAGIDSLFPDGREKGRWHWRALVDLYRRDEPGLKSDSVYQKLTTTLALGVSWLMGTIGAPPPAIQKVLDQPDPLLSSQSSFAFRRTLLRLSWQAASLRWRSCVLQRSRHPDPSVVKALYQDASTLLSNVDISIWSLPRPQTYHTQTYNISEDTVADAAIYPGDVYIYPSADHTILFLRLQAVKLMILIVAVQCRNLLDLSAYSFTPQPPLLESQVENAREFDDAFDAALPDMATLHKHLQTLASAIAAVIPSVSNTDWASLPPQLSHLHHITTPKEMEVADLPSSVMHFMSCIECLPPLQIAWFKGRQKRIADVYGLPCARVYAEKEYGTEGFKGVLHAASVHDQSVADDARKTSGNLIGVWYI